MSADRKSVVGKESVANEENPQRMSTKKGRKSEPLSRPVSFNGYMLLDLSFLCREC